MCRWAVRATSHCRSKCPLVLMLRFKYQLVWTLVSITNKSNIDQCRNHFHPLVLFVDLGGWLQTMAINFLLQSIYSYADQERPNDGFTVQASVPTGGQGNDQVASPFPCIVKITHTKGNEELQAYMVSFLDTYQLLPTKLMMQWNRSWLEIIDLSLSSSISKCYYEYLEQSNFYSSYLTGSY